jgi:hypothetical protein
MSPNKREFVRLTLIRRFWTSLLRREEQGIVLVIVLTVMMLLMGMGLTSLFSGYTNLFTSINLKNATQARNTAEAEINEAIYRLSRQEGQPGAIVPDLNNPDWQVEIDFTSGDSNASDGTVSTLQPMADWPDERPPHSVAMRFKKPNSAHSNDVLFYDRAQNPPFRTITLPATGANPIPDTARPVIQVVATGLGDRDAERQILAEVTETAFIPPAPLSSGANVNLRGPGFIDGVNHNHLIYITAGNGSDAIYGDASSETTDSKNPVKDSPDDNAHPADNVPDCDTGVGNPSLNILLSQIPPGTQTQLYYSCARLFNQQIMSDGMWPGPVPVPPAWVGLQWITDPTNNTEHWHGTNQGYASAVALSSTPMVVRDQPPTGNVWTNGIFTWRANNLTGLGTIQTFCTTTDPTVPPPLVCRPAVLTHGPDSFSSTPHFPYFQEFLGLDDVSFQNLLDKPDTTKADLDAGKPPLGFTYVQGDLTFNIDSASPGTNDFGLLYVTGNLRITGNQTFKGLIFIDGSLFVSGTPTVLGAIMVRGATNRTTRTRNLRLLYSRQAVELGIQTAHPWRILTWEDTAIQG